MTGFLVWSGDSRVWKQRVGTSRKKKRLRVAQSAQRRAEDAEGTSQTPNGRHDAEIEEGFIARKPRYGKPYLATRASFGMTVSFFAEYRAV